MMPIYESHTNLRIANPHRRQIRNSLNWHKIGISLASRKGFTIIELLVVVAIIALLASAVIALFSSARARSRDAKREADIKTLQNALALYSTNTRIYPNPTPGAGICLTGSEAISTALINAGAISAIPLDPQQSCGSGGLPDATNPHYHYTSTDGSTYTITYYLETDSIPGKSAPGQYEATP